MSIKQTLTRVLMNWLPAGEQAQMVSDLIAWVYADLPPAEQRKKIEWVGPRVMAMMRQGRFGLRLLIYIHLLRLPPLRRLRPWLMPTQAPVCAPLARLASASTETPSELAHPDHHQSGGTTRTTL